MPLPMMPTKQWELVRMMDPQALEAAAQGQYLNQGISPVFALARIEEEGTLKAAFQAEEQKRMEQEQAKMQGLPPGAPILDQRLNARGVDSSGITGVDPSAGQEVPPDRMAQLQGGIAGGSPDEMMAGTSVDEMMAAGGLIPRYQTGSQVYDPNDPRLSGYMEMQRDIDETRANEAMLSSPEERNRMRQQERDDEWAVVALERGLKPGSLREHQAMGRWKLENPIEDYEAFDLGAAISEGSEGRTRKRENKALKEMMDQTYDNPDAYAYYEATGWQPNQPRFGTSKAEALSERLSRTGTLSPFNIPEDYVDPYAVDEMPGLGGSTGDTTGTGVTSTGSRGQEMEDDGEVVDLSDILPESAFAGDMLQLYHQSALDRKKRAGEYSEEEMHRDLLRDEELKNQLLDVRREGELWEGQREGRQATQAEYDRLAGERETLAGESTTALENTLAEAYGYGRTQEEELRANQARTEQLRGATRGQLEDLYAKEQATGKSQISDLQRAADFSADAALFTGMGDQFLANVRPQFADTVSAVGKIRGDAMTAVHGIQTGMLDDEKDYVNKLFDVDTDILTGARDTATGVRQIQNNLIDKRVTTDEGIRTIAENLLKDAGTDITKKRNIQDAIDTGDTAALRNLIVAEAGVRGFALTMQEERLGRIEDPDTGYMQDMRPILPTWMSGQSSIEASRVTGQAAAEAATRLTLRNALFDPGAIADLEMIRDRSIDAVNDTNALDPETGKVYPDTKYGDARRSEVVAEKQAAYQRQLENLTTLMSRYADALNDPDGESLFLIEQTIDKKMGYGTTERMRRQPDEVILRTLERVQEELAELRARIPQPEG